MSKTIIKNFYANLRKNSKPPFFKRVLWTGIGAVSYAVFPTMLKGIFKWDMDGWKGLITGAAVPAVIGLGFNKPEIAFGSLASAFCHLTYAKGNGIITQMLGTPIFAFNRSGSMPSELNDALPPGMEEIRMPDGSKILANTNAGVNDYVDSLADYLPALPSQPVATMNDYIATLSDNTYSELNAAFRGVDGIY